MKVISFFQKCFLFLMAAFLPVMASCGGGSDTPCGGGSALTRTSYDPGEEPEVITAPFSGTAVLFYEIEVNYSDETGKVISSNDIYSDNDLSRWEKQTGCMPPTISFDDYYSATYAMETVPDEVRQTMMDLELWDIGRSFTEFTVWESMITTLHDE